MSEAFGLGDGMNDLTHTIAMTDAKVAKATRRSHQLPDTGRWPGPTGLVRVVGSTLLTLILGGWLLTILTATR